MILWELVIIYLKICANEESISQAGYCKAKAFLDVSNHWNGIRTELE